MCVCPVQRNVNHVQPSLERKPMQRNFGPAQRNFRPVQRNDSPMHRNIRLCSQTSVQSNVGPLWPFATKCQQRKLGHVLPNASSCSQTVKRQPCAPERWRYARKVRPAHRKLGPAQRLSALAWSSLSALASLCSETSAPMQRNVSPSQPNAGPEQRNVGLRRKTSALCRQMTASVLHAASARSWRNPNAANAPNPLFF